MDIFKTLESVTTLSSYLKANTHFLFRFFEAFPEGALRPPGQYRRVGGDGVGEEGGGGPGGAHHAVPPAGPVQEDQGGGQVGTRHELKIFQLKMLKKYF